MRNNRHQRLAENGPSRRHALEISLGELLERVGLTSSKVFCFHLSLPTTVDRESTVCGYAGSKVGGLDSRSNRPLMNNEMRWRDPGPVRHPPGFVEPCLPTLART